jgi:rhodanese-related sulfurtransferase
MEPPRIEIRKFKRMLDNGEPVFIIDTRSHAAWDASDVKIPGAVRLHYNYLESRLDEVPRDRPIVAYCT